jgi:hypothetical protein
MIVNSLPDYTLQITTTTAHIKSSICYSVVTSRC